MQMVGKDDQQRQEYLYTADVKGGLRTCIVHIVRLPEYVHACSVAWLVPVHYSIAPRIPPALLTFGGRLITFSRVAVAALGAALHVEVARRARVLRSLEGFDRSKHPRVISD